MQKIIPIKDGKFIVSMSDEFIQILISYYGLETKNELTDWHVKNYFSSALKIALEKEEKLEV
jgi:hypothetical protein